MRPSSPPSELPPEKRSLFYIPDHSIRRAFRLAWRGRLQKLDGLSRLLAGSASVPLWLARMAMDAAVPIDHEHELDAPENDLPALSRAVLAMGLDPRSCSKRSAPAIEEPCGRRSSRLRFCPCAR